MTQVVTALEAGGILSSSLRASPFSLIGPACEGGSGRGPRAPSLPGQDVCSLTSLGAHFSAPGTLHRAVAVVTLYKNFKTLWNERYRTLFYFQSKGLGRGVITLFSATLPV